jgi:hypothetical protein
MKFFGRSTYDEQAAGFVAVVSVSGRDQQGRQ